MIQLILDITDDKKAQDVVATLEDLIEKTNTILLKVFSIITKHMRL